MPAPGCELSVSCLFKVNQFEGVYQMLVSKKHSELTPYNCPVDALQARGDGPWPVIELRPTTANVGTTNNVCAKIVNRSVGRDWKREGSPGYLATHRTRIGCIDRLAHRQSRRLPLCQRLRGKHIALQARVSSAKVGSAPQVEPVPAFVPRTSPTNAPLSARTRSRG